MGRGSPSNLFVLMGPPGSGKSAILTRLRGAFRCVDEPPHGRSRRRTEMSFEETMSFGEALRDEYDRSGYELVRVPRGSIPERADFVREFLTSPR